MTTATPKFYVYDAAYRPNLKAVNAADGVAVGVNGYLTGIYADTTTQPADAHAAGLGYVPTYEEGPAELVHASRRKGRQVGRKILAAFKAKQIPLDGTVAVYPSVDVNVSAGDATACNAAWRGIRDVLAGKVSVRAYAEGAVIDALAAAGLVDGPCWLAAPTSWPGFNVDDPNVGMVQLVGTDVASTDKDHLVKDPSTLGAWWPRGSRYAPVAPVKRKRPRRPKHAPLIRRRRRHVYVVQSGDTLSGIAERWHVSLSAVEKANPRAGHPEGNFDTLMPGDKIVHP